MISLQPLPAVCAGRRRSGGCNVCAARPYSVCASIPDADLHRLDALAETVVLARDQALVREGDPTDHVFNLTQGLLRLSRLLPDGRRQVVGFAFAGAFVGLETGATYGFTAEAVDGVRACRFRKSAYRALMDERPELEAALLERAGDRLAAANDRIVLLGRKTALERLASFLIEMRDADPLYPDAPGAVRLPMTRTDIADYLGLTLETVSRSMTRLKALGLVDQVTLSDLNLPHPAALRALATGEA